MKRHSYKFLLVLATGALSLLPGAPQIASARPNAALSVPASLQPPAGDTLKLRAVGKGVQIYQCTAGSDPGEHYEWKLLGPEADLLGHKSHVLAKHYAGPTWEANDGSKVVGEVLAHEDSPDPGAIPWLLLNAKSTSGSGVFASVHSIQRLQTHGGKAPADACASGNANQVVRVPYSAHYYFFIAH